MRIRREEHPFQRLHDEIVVVHARRREVHTLNEPAARVWELVREERACEELVALLGEEYDALPGEIGRDVAELVADLEAKGLVTVRRP